MLSGVQVPGVRMARYGGVGAICCFLLAPEDHDGIEPVDLGKTASNLAHFVF
jgi:hypothetical protein